MNYIIQMALFLVQYDILQMSETSLFLVLNVTKVFESLINTKIMIINITKMYKIYFTYALRKLTIFQHLYIPTVLGMLGRTPPLPYMLTDYQL